MNKAFLLFSVILFLLSFTSAIGVTPPRIIIDDALKGSTIQQSVTLVDVQQADTVSISFSGEGSDWVTSVKGNTFTVEDARGENIPFQIALPASAPNGQYQIIAQITLTPAAQEGGGATTASVISALQVSLQFTITGQEVRKFEVRSVSIPDIEVGMPLAVVTSLKNQGNVLVKPSTIEVDIKDKETREILYMRSSSPKEDVDPFVVGESVATFSIDLDEDLYFADIRVFDDGQIIFTETDLPFDVLAQGTLAASAQLTQLSVQDKVADLAKITGTIANTGTSGFFASLQAEVYYEEVLIDALESDEVFISEGDKQEFSLLYEPEKKGEYKVVAYASFAGKKSEIKELTFSASPSGKAGNKVFLITTLAIILVILVTLGVFISLSKKKGKGETE